MKQEKAEFLIRESSQCNLRNGPHRPDGDHKPKYFRCSAESHTRNAPQIGLVAGSFTRIFLGITVSKF